MHVCNKFWYQQLSLKLHVLYPKWNGLMVETLYSTGPHDFTPKFEHINEINDLFTTHNLPNCKVSKHPTNKANGSLHQ